MDTAIRGIINNHAHHVAGAYLSTVSIQFLLYITRELVAVDALWAVSSKVNVQVRSKLFDELALTGL